MNKKVIKLTLFNLAFVIIAILAFSKRVIGLSFDLSGGALKFAFSIAFSFLWIALFGYGNYVLIGSKETVNYKFDKLSTIEQAINSLEKCKKTDPSFKEEIERAIEQLRTLERRRESLTMLLEQCNATNSFEYLNNTADKANFFVFVNVKKIIKRLIVFDNEEYLKNKEHYSITEHKDFINEIISDNDDILRAYSELLLAVSGIGDDFETRLEEIQDMTDALNKVLKRERFASLERTYSEQNNGGMTDE